MKMNFAYKIQGKLFRLCLASVTGCLLSPQLFAQAERQKIAVFTPLYLDSVFDATGKFRFEKTGARMSSAGLDFYYGVQMALDSLKKRNAQLEVYIYDSRGKQGLEELLAKEEFEDIDLVIAQSSADETRTLASFVQQKKIPFISATLPNDAGIFNNPYYVVLNSTLQAHVEGIYRFLQKYHSLENIIVFTKPGTQEDRIKSYFEEFSKSTTSTKLQVRFVDAGNNFTAQTLLGHLDSTKRTVCIAGSLDENFGNRLIQTLDGLNNTYTIRLIGMPTWENLNFNRANDLEIIFTTPFYYSRNIPLESQLAKTYGATMSNKPSDYFYRGYETMLRFSLLLLDTKKDMASNLSRKGNTVLTQFDIQPVFKDKTSMTLDYFENKHLYFIKAFGGVKNIIN